MELTLCIVLSAVAAVCGIVSLVSVLSLRRTASRTEQRTDERLDRAENEISARMLEHLTAAENRITNSTGAVARANTEAMLGTQKLITEMTTKSIDELRTGMENRLTAIQNDNAKKLEEMRATVDEKLSTTLNTRLTESFRQVSERLEAVSKGLGEMQSLAGGVGDLKRVLTNVKQRGTWGEIQLGALLEQILSPKQFVRNFKPRPTGQSVVEFAVVLPGQSEGESVYLPMDSKFPVEAYLRLCTASENADPAAVEAAQKELTAQIKLEAASIAEKYIVPPRTTDFAIMFLPSEGLYAEVVRSAVLCEELQQRYRVVVAGPSTLTALLNSLQMGFTTLAIQKSSSEVWKLLAAFRAEFKKYNEALSLTKKKIGEVADSLEKAEKRTTIIDRKLRTVTAMEQPEVDALLGSEEESVL